jgi:hypothetical protein
MRMRPSVRKLPPRAAAGLAAAGVAALVLAAAGCGTARPARTTGNTATGAGGTFPVHSQIVLDIALTHAAAGERTHWTLRCDPPGGNDPDAASACATLMRMKDPFTRVSFRHVNCPMIMVSDKQYVVTGTWYGSKVHRAIVDGGCDLRLFGTMSKILR